MAAEKIEHSQPRRFAVVDLVATRRRGGGPSSALTARGYLQYLHLLAPSPAFRTLPAEERHLDQTAALGIRLPYVMHSGSIEGRKNIENLLRAFSGLPATIRNRHQVVLAGNHHPVERERIRAVAHSLGVEAQLVFPGHLSDEELIVLYNNCRLFVLPSFHEGFGLPALEAMACGAATIGSNWTSIPEVIGMEDALFDPDDVRSMTAMISAGLNDEKFRARLLANASERAKAFSWQITAERALGAMRAVVGSNLARQEAWADFRRAKRSKLCAAGEIRGVAATSPFVTCADGHRHRGGCGGDRRQSPRLRRTT